MHAWDIVYSLDFDSFSAIVAVGGDGTMHEVVNGMLNRKDKKRLPLALIPNGSGNDLCGSFRLNTVEEALDYLIAGEAVKIDAVKVLLDHENEEEMAEDKKLQCTRYSVINSSFALVAKIAHKAVNYKRWIGKHSYTYAALKEFFRLSYDRFDIEINGQIVLTD